MPAVTYAWLEANRVALLSEEEYRNAFCVQFGLLPLAGYRMSPSISGIRHCAFCAHRGQERLELPAHLLSACPRFLNIRRLRHDAVAALVVAAVRASPVMPGATRQKEVVRERSLGCVAVDGSVSDVERRLRPDAYVFDHDLLVITPVEFTVPDDAHLVQKIAQKQAKYNGVVARARPAPPGYSFARPVVIAVGAMGAIPPHTLAALTILGVPYEAIQPLLIRVLRVVMRYNAMTARIRFALGGRWVPQPSVC